MTNTQRLREAINRRNTFVRSLEESSKIEGRRFGEMSTGDRFDLTELGNKIKFYTERVNAEKKIKAMGNKKFAIVWDMAMNSGLDAGRKCQPTPMVVSGGVPGGEVRKDYISEGMCGFAWVNIKNGNSKFAKWVKEMGYGRKDCYYKGVTVWAPREFGQSVARKEAWADAMADTLNSIWTSDMGVEVKAWAGSRLD